MPLDLSKGPLAPLGAKKQFVLYRVAPSTTRPGKTDKFPLNAAGEISDAHNQANWLSWQEAAALAEAFGPNHGVGFVFTDDDPFFFIDIDACEENGQWNDTAKALLSRFPGAAVEVSNSGRGLHIIACGDAGPPPPHRKVKYHHYFDLYTENRFVALTGTGAMGDAATDHTPALKQLVAEYLQPDPGTTIAKWSDGPREDWKGHTDDDRLIAAVIASVTAKQAFGGRITNKDLWEGNAVELAKFYPSSNDAPYDASAADSALAQVLAFWTGNDCERIKRLMLRSGLVRDKWDRPDYLPRTILGVVSRQFDVCRFPDAAPINQAAPASGKPTYTMTDGGTFLTPEDQMKVFEGCVWVEQMNRALVPGGVLLAPDQFRVRFGGRNFVMDASNERVVRDAWEAFTQNQVWSCPKVSGIAFRPDLPPGDIVNKAGTAYVNTWFPATVPMVEGDPSPYLDLLNRMIPNDADRASLLAYFAACVQHPGVKFQWAPLIQGVEGNGKTFLATAVARAIGDQFVHKPNAADLGGGGGKFTAWLQGKLFIIVEEIYTADRREVLDILKPMITNDMIEIQGKGKDQYTGDNRANFVALSNHKDAIPKSTNDRRWAIFYCAQQKTGDLARDRMDGQFFPDLWDWAEGRGRWAGQAPGFLQIAHFLKHYSIPAELNPAINAHRAPVTSSTSEAVELSTGIVEQEILEAISRGDMGFIDGWISSMAVDKLLERIGYGRRISPRKRVELITELGYMPHPAFEYGRVHNRIQPDNGRTKLFIKTTDTLKANLSAALAAKTYSEAQQKPSVEAAQFDIDGIGNKG